MDPKVLLLADVNSSHIEKWALSLADRGYKIGLFSLNKCTNNWFHSNKNIVLLYQPANFTNASSLRTKLQCLLKLPLLYKKINEFKPDILHAHYATSYGLLGFLSGFRPFILSVWESDVLEFPKKSFFHKALFKLNLKHADKVLTTSYSMKKELGKYINRPIGVTPFSLDTTAFYPKEVKKETEKDTLYLGIIKPIEEKYGITVIIHAVQLLKLEFPALKFKVLVVGDGSMLYAYKQMVNELGLEKLIFFTGAVPASDIPYYHNLLDIFLNVSIVNEGFCGSVVEAMACAKPVIVTNTPGLVEIVKKDTGIIIDMNNAFELVNALKLLITDRKLALCIGEKAREHVTANYELDNCVKLMTGVYEATLMSSFANKLRFRLLNTVFA